MLCSRQWTPWHNVWNLMRQMPRKILLLSDVWHDATVHEFAQRDPSRDSLLSSTLCLSCKAGRVPPRPLGRLLRLASQLLLLLVLKVSAFSVALKLHARAVVRLQRPRTCFRAPTTDTASRRQANRLASHAQTSFSFRRRLVHDLNRAKLQRSSAHP